jgi:ADP-heptose:LPS heptosyltransferase
MEAKIKNNEISAEPNQKTLCLVQLTRLGDLIQTAQVTKKLKESRKDIKVILVARKQFASPLKFLLDEVFDEVHTLDFTDMTKAETSNLEDTLSNMQSFLDEINKTHISAVINLSFSKPAGYLCSIIKADHKLGVFYDNFSNMIVKDHWSQFVYSNVLGSNLNPYSLVDLYSNIIGIDKTALQPVATKGKGERILIHPFGSLSRKKWKASKWAELVFKLLKDNPELVIDIAGGKEDVQDVTSLLSSPVLADFHKRINNHVGKKSIEEIYNLLDEVDLFIGHDSMVGHLASYKHVQTITVSLGSVRPTETTPYLAGAYVLAPRTSCFPCQPSEKCELFQCHSDISYQVAYSVVNQIRKEGEVDIESLSKNISSFHLTSVDIYRAELNESGYYRLKNMTFNAPDIKDVFRELYRITWSFLLDEVEENLPFPKLTTGTHQALLNSIQGFQHLYELCEFGKRYSKYILQEISADTPDIVKIKGFSKKIDEIDHLKTLLVKTNPYLAPIIDFYRMRKGNLQGENVVELTENSYLVYEECGNVCSVMYELIEKVIAEHKIKNGIKTQDKTSNA